MVGGVGAPPSAIVVAIGWLVGIRAWAPLITVPVLAITWTPAAFLSGTKRISLIWGMAIALAGLILAIECTVWGIGESPLEAWPVFAVLVPLGEVMAYIVIVIMKNWILHWYPHWIVKKY